MFCALNQLNKVWHVWPGSNDFHWIGSLGLDSHWPVELTNRLWDFQTWDFQMILKLVQISPTADLEVLQPGGPG
jgi:hypothetical protein